MNERLKYGYNCVRKFENFEQNVAAGEFPTMLIEVIRDQRWDSAANWRFDFETKMFDCWRKEEHIYVRSSLYKITIIFYWPKELLLFHSSSKEFKHLYLPFKDDHLDICLQIAHWVRIRGTHRAPIQGATWLEYAKIGREMGMMNIVHYCDRMYVRNYPGIIDKNDLKKAIKLNMKQSVPHIMGLWELKELLKELTEDLDELPGEMMKMLVAKIFEDFRRFSKNFSI